MSEQHTVKIVFPERSPETELAEIQFASFLAEMIIKYGPEVLKETEDEKVSP